MGAWKESPSLEWNEKFTTVDHLKRSYWIHENDMFAQKPSSNTFSAWSGLYFHAYDFVTKGDSFCKKVPVKFFTVKGGPVKKKDLGNKPDITEQQKSDMIRSYIKSNGCIIEVVVHDIPSILIGKNNEREKHIERLLLFNIRLSNGTVRLRAMQYLDMHSTVPPQNRPREVKMSSFSRMDQKTFGYQSGPAPSDVTSAAGALMNGEYL